MYIYAALIFYRLASLPWKIPSPVKPVTPNTRRPITHRPIIRRPIVRWPIVRSRPPASKATQKSSTMPRTRPDVTITTNPPIQQTFLFSPTPTTTTFHINPPALSPFPSFQTFLLSPTPSPSPTKILVDSPVLPPSPILPPFCSSRLPTPTPTLPAYPTPRNFYDDSLDSLPLLSDHSSSSSDLSIAQTAVEDTLAPQTTRLSDILPNDMDLYAGEEEDGEDKRPNTRRWSRALTGELLDTVIEPDVAIEQGGVLEQTEVVPIQEENVADLVLGPEVQGALPFIKEHDHPYYPPLSHLPPPRSEREKEDMARKSSRKLIKKNRGDGSGGGMRILLKRMLRKAGKMRKS